MTVRALVFLTLSFTLLGEERLAIKNAGAQLGTANFLVEVLSEFVVWFNSEPTTEQLESCGVKTATKLGTNIFRVEFHLQGTTLEEAREKLAGIARFVETNTVSQATTPIISQTKKFEAFSSPSVMTGTNTASNRPAYLDAIGIEKLLTTRTSSSQKTRFVICDSGVNTAELPTGFTINTTLSKSFVGGNPFKDSVGHGTVVSTIATNINPIVEVVSLQILFVCGNNAGGCGSLDTLVAALAEISTWKKGVPTVINMSLQNYPPSDIVLQLMKKTGAVFMLIAGNNSASPATYPGWYAHQLSNAICVGSVELGNRLKSYYSNYGETVDGAAFGTLSSGHQGTSFAAPQFAGVASLIWNDEFSPALIKKILVGGGKYDSFLVGVFGNPTTLSGDGALGVLDRLKSIRLSTGLPEVLPGKSATVFVTDLPWLKNFLGSDLPQFKLTDSSGNSTNVVGGIDETGLWFIATASGNYKIRLVVSGLVLDDEIDLVVSTPAPIMRLRRPYQPPRPRR